MADPLEALRLPLMPISPDPGFARRLRARLAVAAAPTRGATMTTFLTQDDHAPATTTAASGSTAGAERGGPVHAGAAIPYLAVPDGRGHEAIDWYVVVLGGRLVGEPIVMDDGRIGHAELAFAHGLLYLAEAFPEDRGHGAGGRPARRCRWCWRCPTWMPPSRPPSTAAPTSPAPCTRATAIGAAPSSTPSAIAGCCRRHSPTTRPTTRTPRAPRPR